MPRFDILGAMDQDKVVRIVGYVIAAVLLPMGIMKFIDPGTGAKFVAWGWPAWLGFVTGAAEATAGALLLVRPTAVYGAAIAAGVMAGAIFTHLRVPEVGLLPLAIPLFAAAVYVAWTRRPDWVGGQAAPA